MNIAVRTLSSGVHIDTTVLANALACAGVVDPGTKAPFSEATLFGIAGGIGGGVSDCPSMLKWGVGAGITFVGRFNSNVCDGGYKKTLLDRLGVPYRVTEASTPRAGLKKLVAELEDGPVVVQCSKALPWHGARAHPHLCSVMDFNWALLVLGVDQEGEVADVAGLAPTAFSLDLETLAAVRGQTCTHKNRTFAVRAPKKAPTRTAVKDAMLDGLRACVADQRRPKTKTFSLANLAVVAKRIGNLKTKKGWKGTYGARVFWALSDLVQSVDGQNTGGGLMRPLFADFLEDAAERARKKALRACAEDYRKLGAQWTAFADAALPGRDLKKARDVGRRIDALFAEKGAAAMKQIDKSRAKAAELRTQYVKAFPLDDQKTDALLLDLSTRLQDLHDAEWAALDRLEKAL